ncbi:MAG TPA: hypothetical protein PKH77_00555 [Anaerolineae bacterium]|nr:hypothetical protein [Anaerolineae bacterium]
MPVMSWWSLTTVPVFSWLLWQLRTQARDPVWRGLLLFVGLARICLPPDDRVWGGLAVLCLLGMVTFSDHAGMGALLAGAATLCATASGPAALTVSAAWIIGWLLPWPAGERVLAITALTVCPDPCLAWLLLAATGLGWGLGRLRRGDTQPFNAVAWRWPWLLVGLGLYGGLRGWGLW